jgi:signal transduction histidine kinase
MSTRAADKDYPRHTHLLTVSVAEEAGVVTARQRARQLASLLGFDHQDQIRIATATSEIARNALQYGRDGRVEFFADRDLDTQSFMVKVSDTGPGIEQLDAVLNGSCRSKTGMGLGLSGTRRLMDRFSLESAPNKGTSVTFAKTMPHNAPKLDDRQISQLSEQLAREKVLDVKAEVRQQNQEMLVALELIRGRENELEKKRVELARINQELEETNRGVVALYSELDERASALRQASEVKTRFLSYMSHEFRTPLNSILALADLLLRRADGDLTEEQERQIKFVRASSYELLEMVNDLLDMAKVEAGKVDLRIGTVEVAKLLGSLRGMMRPLLQTERVNLVLEDPPEDLRIISDEGKISQILRNLISNALKFTEQGEVRISVNCQRGKIIFCVSDTGIGIAKDHQESIFHEFSQIENSVQRKVRGTGLGLPLSRKLSELLGGTLTVESTLGKGSIFCLSLPLVLSDPTAQAGSGRSSANSVTPLHALPTGQERDENSILVIDDEEVARYLARQLFRGTRHLITEASSGSEGLERARFDRPSLILLDITMPDRNGFDVLDDLKSDPATLHIPVVIHTSSKLTADDLSRLDGRHATILPKYEGDHEPALKIIRELLSEPHLFFSSAKLS